MNAQCKPADDAGLAMTVECARGFCGPIEWATSWFERARGLLGRAPTKGILVLAPCNDVHTWGMSHHLDVAFVGGDGKVVAAIRDLPPRRRVRCSSAAVALERFASSDAWFDEGDCVCLAFCAREDFGNNLRAERNGL